MILRNEGPPVSVVIPTFNRGWIIKEAIESVLRQNYPNFELIVVDDGSTDDTALILDHYGDRIVSIRQENAGVSAARNRGIREASGELIAFLDSDDLWLPGKLKRQAEFLEADPGACICQTEEVWIRNGCRVNPKNKHRKESGIIFERSLALCLVSPSAVMIRRRLFDEVGLFDENLPACEDYDLWLRIGCRYPVYLIEEPLIVKRGGHADQLSRASGLDRFRIDALIKIIESGQLAEKQRQAAVETLTRKCRIYANGCLKRGKKSEAMDCIELAEKYGKS
ncbi:MAG: glycosyltransferase [Desulfobacteraceae bacterium]|nr:MAG: glycosyltransferase [Desulfobacteraceae bacterium]